MMKRLMISILMVTVLGASCKRNAAERTRPEAISKEKEVGSEKKKEKEKSTADLGPSFSPDGKKLVFYSYLDEGIAHLFTMNIDGTELKDISSNAPSGWHTEPVWSPGGKKIGYTNFMEKGAKIMAIDSDGTNIRPLASVSENGFHMFSSWDATGEGYYFFHWPINVGFKPNAYYAKGEELVQLTHDSISNRPQLASNGTLFINKIVDLENNLFEKYVLETTSYTPKKVPQLEGDFISGNHVLKQHEDERGTTFILEDLNGKDLKELGTVPYKEVMFSRLDLNQQYVAYNTSFDDGAEIHLLEIGTGKFIKLTENDKEQE